MKHCLFLSSVLLALSSGIAAEVHWKHLSSASGELPVPNGGAQQTACVIGDIDKDGVNDIVLSERTKAPAIIWLRHTAHGWDKYVIDDTLQHPEAGGVLFDVNGDGYPDLIIGGDWQSKEVWWFQNPGPNFDAQKPWKRHLIKTGGATQHHDQVIADFKGIGTPQLAFWNQGAKKLFLADMPKDLLTATNWPAIPVFEGIKGEGTYAFDIDGDGKVDLLAGNYWFKHNGGTNFTAVQIGKQGGRIAAGKFKPGRYPQIVIAPGDGTGPLMIYECKGDPLKSSDWIGKDLIGREIIHGHSLQISDIDGDGNLDIFYAEMAKWTEKKPEPDNPNATAWILYGDGQGNFTTTVFATGMGFHEARVADINGDGKLDIINKPYNWETPRLDIWLNEGTK